MQIELLDTFLDLAETRSFHRTSDRLGITQSTVSSRVTALEQAVGSRLFDRSRAGTDLTAEGKRFEPHARALRHEWNEARRRIQIPQGAAHLVRLGIQNDLAALYLGDWMTGFRQALPEAAFYIEPDYSNQMCADLLTGILDFAVMFSPKPHPDLHFESVGDVAYRMVSTDTGRLAEVTPERFVFAHFSPAFEEMHRQLTPGLAGAAVSVGQSASVVSLLMAMGGSGYVLEKTAEALTAGGFRLVADAPVLRQPVFAALHIRHRIAPLHRRLAQLVARHLA
ncbi:MAG: LysR family transcriptional regulator [Tabrizicola sp.]|uniref:LysR family transcriptional regulator n=1 Tax=Tabrizicola sp. TaxID=2005166 RepID=UPI002735DDA6|nr:LysR family transcriptional regulator [Tabrizicola sp.]MDP3264515.1 LysR family transcriptional regulator [Tabrizicola sp.]MDP3649505.1 LysR family transcriptional regulator [Paracoccaceae bacterium]MDZ4069251.1 LysR family transcriptional regulator [Tabrizicola sp.]